MWAFSAVLLLCFYITCLVHKTYSKKHFFLSLITICHVVATKENMKITTKGFTTVKSYTIAIA